MFLCCEEKGKRIPGPYQALVLFRLLCLYLPQGFVLPNYSLLFFFLVFLPHMVSIPSLPVSLLPSSMSLLIFLLPFFFLR